MIAAAALLVPFGLGQWMPMPAGGHTRWQGLSWAAGMALLILGLYALTALGAPAHVAAWTVAAAGAAGLVPAVRRLRLAGREDLAHPVPALALVILAAALLHAGKPYVIYAWDEWTNWLGWARSIVAFDRVAESGMVVAVRGDTPGWALALAFPGLLTGQFTEMPAVAAGAALHLGLLGVAFDLGLAAAVRVGGLGKGPARALAWIWLATLLAVEVSWHLVPTLLLVDEPQVWLMGSVALLTLALPAAGPDRLRLAALVGLLGAAAYAVKISYLTLLPAVGLMATLAAVAERRDGGVGRAIAVLGLALLPFLAVKASWAGFADSSRCAAHLGDLLGAVVSGTVHQGETPAALALRMLVGLGEFLRLWKLPLTLVAALGVAVAFARPLTAASALGVLAFLALNFVGAFALISTCFTPREYAELASFERYMRIPLRVTQLMGCAYLLLATLATLRRHPLPARLLTRVAAAVAVILLAAQGWRAHRSYAEVEQRPGLPAEVRGRLDHVRAFAPAAARILAEHGLPQGGLLLVTRLHDDMAIPAADYEGLGRRRGDSQVRFLARSMAHLTAPPGPDVVAVWLLDDGDALRREMAATFPEASCPPPGGNLLLIRGSDGSWRECVAVSLP